MKKTFDLTLLQIDPGSVIPLYHQIKQNIRELIDNKVLADGDLLPSEHELGDVYGVNRLTVRHALNDLVNEGMLQRQRGVGTFVAVSKLAQAIDWGLGFSDCIQEAGHQPSSRFVSVETVPAAPSIARHLAVQPQAALYKLVRLSCADGKPVMLETAYFPVALFPELDAMDLSVPSLYHVISEKYNCLIQEVEEQLEPVILTNYEAQMLEVEPNLPGMLVQSTSFDQFGKPVEFRKAVVRGDRARFMFHIRRHAKEHKVRIHAGL